MENSLTLSELSIEKIVEDIFVNYKVKKRRKDIVDFYLQVFNVGLFGNDESNLVTENDICKKIDSILKDDKNSEYPYLRYKSPYYFKQKHYTQLPSQITTTQQISTNYIGKGGECMVMGELLFRGYNVNNMLVDEGIDIVASKNNVFYYIQVKTTNVTIQNKFHFKINQDKFNQFLDTQIRYVLVARCSVQNKDTSVYFIFANKDIQRFLHDNVIPTNNGTNTTVLSIKIEYDVRTGVPYMYDGNKRADISFYMNNFDL